MSTIRVRKGADSPTLARVVEMQVGQQGEAELVALGDEASQTAIQAVGLAAMNIFNAALRLKVAGFGDGGLPSLTAELAPYVPEDIQVRGVPPHGVKITVRRPESEQ